MIKKYLASIFLFVVWVTLIGCLVPRLLSMANTIMNFLGMFIIIGVPCLVIITKKIVVKLIKNKK